MPIVDVRIVVAASGAMPPGTAQALADAVGACLSAAPGQVWLRLEPLPAEHYAENQVPLDGDALPVFVRVLQRQPPAGARRQAEARRITDAVANTLRRPAERVHVEYAAPGRGRMAFGGKLVD